MLWTSLQNGAFPCKSYRPMLASGRSGRCASPPALWWELQLILMQLFLQEDAAITMNGSNSGDKEDPCMDPVPLGHNNFSWPLLSHLHVAFVYNLTPDNVLQSLSASNSGGEGQARGPLQCIPDKAQRPTCKEVL